MSYRYSVQRCMSFYHVSWMVYVLQVLCTAWCVILSCLMAGLCVTGALYSLLCHLSCLMNGLCVPGALYSVVLCRCRRASAVEEGSGSGDDKTNCAQEDTVTYRFHVAFHGPCIACIKPPPKPRPTAPITEDVELTDRGERFLSASSQ